MDGLVLSMAVCHLSRFLYSAAGLAPSQNLERRQGGIEFDCRVA